MLSWPYLPLSAALALKLIFTKMVSLMMCPVIFIFTPLQLPVSRFSATEIHQPSRSLSTFHWTDINQCGFCFTSISSKLLKQHSDNIIISCSIVPLNNFYVSVVSFNIHIVLWLLCYHLTAVRSSLIFYNSNYSILYPPSSWYLPKSVSALLALQLI